MSVEVSKTYQHEIDQHNEGNLPPPTEGGDFDTEIIPSEEMGVELEATTEMSPAEQADSQMAEIEARYPRMANIRPDAYLATEYFRMEGDAAQAQKQRDELHDKLLGPGRYTVRGKLEDVEKDRQALYDREIAPLDRQIEEIKSKANQCKAAHERLKENGQDDFADGFFSGREQKAAERLQQTVAEQRALEARGVGDSSDLDEMQSRIAELKNAREEVMRAQHQLKMATDQRVMLELMAQKAQQPRA